MSDEPKFTYLGESGTKVVLEMTLDGEFSSYVSMRKATFREFPKIIPDPFKEDNDSEKTTQDKHRRRI